MSAHARRRDRLRDVTSAVGGLCFGGAVFGGFVHFGGGVWQSALYAAGFAIGAAAVLQLVLFPAFGDEGGAEPLEATPEWFAELAMHVEEPKATTAHYRGVHR